MRVLPLDWLVGEIVGAKERHDRAAVNTAVNARVDATGCYPSSTPRPAWGCACRCKIWVVAAAVFYLAAMLFLANFALGLLVQFRLVDTKPFRWLHHALFFAVFVSAVAAFAVGFAQGAPYRWALLPALVLFVVLPYVRAGTRGHAALACGALVFYVVGFVAAL